MFTGIVEEVGHLRSAAPTDSGLRLTFAASVVLHGMELGASVAVNGCCLTVVEVGDGWWAADVVGETLARTNLGALAVGDPVDLERPLHLDGRLDGHLVQGHVDGVGTIVTPAPDLRIAVPDHLLRYLAEKGSITVDGTSLTVVDVFDDGFSVAIIPHTASATVLGSKDAGAAVNLEVDVIARYTERLLLARGAL